jgi:hypothetical protein
MVTGGGAVVLSSEVFSLASGLSLRAKQPTTTKKLNQFQS